MQEDNDKAVDQDLRDSLVEAYIAKKRMRSRNYMYIGTKKGDEYFDNAARLCAEFQMHPARYVQVMWDRMGENKEFFGPQHLQGKNVKAAIKDMADNLESYNVDVNNATLSYDDLWNFQHQLAMNYLHHGEDLHDILMDSSIKFFGWFRILATPERDDGVIKKYRKIAQDEVTKDFEAFAKKYNLDLSRIG